MYEGYNIGIFLFGDWSLVIDLVGSVEIVY